ncbi:MAG: GIY-YIG nuclease family protein [Coxiellaceae bacterium]|nr:MAG: GIY-YIG nuclease family protein [Coxiellaceae bacterium]
MEKSFYVYILTNKRNGTLYIGVTSDLLKRIGQHKSGVIPGFTQKYNTKMLVYYEQHNHAESAIHREKRLKEWKRTWKLALIERQNPSWRDLYSDIVG